MTAEFGLKRREELTGEDIALWESRAPAGICRCRTSR
jgi:hypothetical protein